MTKMTDNEWACVQKALCAGGLRETINNILSAHATHAPNRILGVENHHLLRQAWDDGTGRSVILIAGEEPPWFIGKFEDYEVCEGLEHDGTLYVAVPQSGGGLVSVFVGEELRDNNAGVTLHSMAEAKAYIQGRIAHIDITIARQ